MGVHLEREINKQKQKKIPHLFIISISHKKRNASSNKQKWPKLIWKTNSRKKYYEIKQTQHSKGTHPWNSYVLEPSKQRA